MRTTTEKIIEAYFQGGNAKDRNSREIKSVMKAIIEIMEEEEKELRPVRTPPPNPDPYD